jgi:hypothetical protein
MDASQSRYQPLAFGERMNTSATLAHLRNRLFNIDYDRKAERNEERNGYGYAPYARVLDQKLKRLRRAVKWLEARRDKQQKSH